MTKSNWEKIKLGDIADVVGGGTPSTKEDSFWNGNVPWLTPKDLSGYNSRYITRGERNISDEGLKNSSATLIPAETVLLTSRAPIGYVAIAKNPISTNQGFKSLVLKKGHYPLFYYYLLKANVEYLRNMGTGSTFKEVSGSVVKGLTFYIPTTFDEQKRIAGILGAFDDKIELLQKQNKTLEDMAKAIFKSWFVDFDIVKAKQKGLPKADIIREYHLTQELYDLFPSTFTDSPLGPIPTGWEVKTVQDIAKVFSGKRPQSAQDQKSLTHNIAVYGGNGIKWWTETPLYTTPIIITGRVGTLGQVYRIYDPVWISDNALVFETHLDNFEYLFYMLKNVDFASFNRGSTQPLITQGDIKNISLVYSAEIIKEFHNIVVEYEKKILLNNKQIQTLTELRDTLLPPLISGKIRV